MANSITNIRIACGIALVFCPAFSPAFYTLYIIAGVSDMIDGTVARKREPLVNLERNWIRWPIKFC